MNRQLFNLKCPEMHLEVKMVEEPEVEVESVFPRVPSRDHWFQFSIAPDDFDPEKVWTVIQRSRTILGGDSWQCVFCGLTFRGFHATKATFHLAKAVGGGIKACNAKMPEWLFESFREDIR